MDAARALKEQDPDYNSFLAAALVFRTAAAAFQAAGDNARAQSATNEAQTLEDNIKIASEKAGLRENQNGCSVLRGNAFQCYIRVYGQNPFLCRVKEAPSLIVSKPIALRCNRPIARCQ
jgi:hypothetical protein